ncbi:MAG: DUF1566 domain-containing protein, partial [Rhodoferax sp.]|nr:DUF1566 domain-containing protein [Rhodoferax sp.]
VTVTDGQTATFTVVATGTQPLRYQWTRNDTAIPNATGSSYTTPATTVADNGAFFSVVVSNVAGTVKSDSNGIDGAAGSATDVVLRVTHLFTRVANSSGGLYDLTDCVQDNSTGLVWEGKPTTGTNRLASARYTNYDSTSSPQKGVGSNPSSSDISAATNSIKLVTDANAGSGLCGFTNWRMPTKEELLGIFDFRYPSPSIDSSWFPNTASVGYWSSSGYVGQPEYAYFLSFGAAFPSSTRRSTSLAVRLVRCSNGSATCP